MNISGYEYAIELNNGTMDQRRFLDPYKAQKASKEIRGSHVVFRPICGWTRWP